MSRFQGLDARLNVWALANGVELQRDLGGEPCRVLAWYADRAERRMIVRPSGDDDLFDLHLSTGGGRGTVDRSVAFRTGVRADELTRLLDEAVETTNALSPDHREDVVD